MSDLRASDADRELIVSGLRFHHSAGRLTDEELEQRLSVALAARTQGELTRLVEDLPPPDWVPAAAVVEGPGTVVLSGTVDAVWQRMLDTVVPALVGAGGYAVVAQEPPHWITFERAYRPPWVWVLVILTFPVGLLALLIRSSERAGLIVSDAGGGRTRIEVTGPPTPAVIAALSRLRGH